MVTLSEAESKSFLAAHGVVFPREAVVATAAEAAGAATEIGFPAVVKLCGDAIAHKTERGLVRLGLRDAAAVEAAAADLLAMATAEDGEVGLLVAPMVSGLRELIAGVVSDAQFGPCVMVGVGGVLTEVLADAVFRMAPISRVDALEMIGELRSQALLGPVRGEPELDRVVLAELLVALGAAGSDARVRSIDCNPLIISAGRPVPVDALVELHG